MTGRNDDMKQHLHHPLRVWARHFSATCVAFQVLQAHAADWPQWRGENRDGHAAAHAPTISSLPKDVKPVWKIAIGPGFSSPILAGGKLIYLDAQDGQEVVHAVTAARGQELWQTPFAKAEGDEWGSGPRSTPFVEGDRVYVQSMDGHFRCLNLADGKILWSVPFEKYGIHFSAPVAASTQT